MSCSSGSLVASLFAQFYNSFGEKWPCLAVEHIYMQNMTARSFLQKFLKHGTFHISHKGFSNASVGDTCVWNIRAKNILIKFLRTLVWEKYVWNIKIWMICHTSYLKWIVSPQIKIENLIWGRINEYRLSKLFGPKIASLSYRRTDMFPRTSLLDVSIVINDIWYVNLSSKRWPLLVVCLAST